MANTTSKVAVIFAMLLFLQLSYAATARRHGHARPGGTPAVMTLNSFQKGKDGGAPSECDGHYHSDHDMLVALSTRWYDHGRRCFKKIRITSAHTGHTVEATVVDECDTPHVCRNNDVDTSATVWKALGLDTKIGEVPVSWSDA